MEKKTKGKQISRLYSSITISNLWLSILSLAKKEPVYAYVLPQKISQTFGFLPSRLLVYLVLYSLESEGFLSSFEGEQRKYYRITKKGASLLKEGKKMLLERSKEL